MNPTCWRRLWLYYVAFVLAFPLSMAWVETHQLSDPTICLFRLTTGLDCPACGLTRAFRAMGRLDASAAFRYNPLGPLIFLVVAFAWMFALGRVCTGGALCLPLWVSRWQIPLLWGGLTLFLLVGVVRIGYEICHPVFPR